MRLSFIRAVLTLVVVLTIAPARAANDTNIVGYKCSQFLGDVMQPKAGAPLLRSMLVIAWSTGYAAAYQKDNARADPKAFRLIAAALASACIKNPNEPVIQAGVEEVHQVFTGQQK